MNLKAFGIGTALAVTAASALTAAQAPTVDELISQAKAAAGTAWPGTFARLCIPPPPTAGRGGGGQAPAAQGGRGAVPAAAQAQPQTPPRENWYAEPAKVGDNLYFLGTKAHHAFALVGSEGIIVIEALYAYAANDEIIGGLKAMGLDPAKVKYAVMSHAHGDHDGGAKILQDAIPGLRLVYGAEDWALVEARQGEKPRRDLVGTDGLRLSVGDASLQIVTMPGHTDGTLSYLFEFKDHGRPIRVAYVGGTAIPFNQQAAYYDKYIASSKKFAQAAAAFGATAVMSNHTEFDNGYFKAHTAAARKSSGVANPFDVGREAVARYFTVVQSCTEAAKIRARQGQS